MDLNEFTDSTFNKASVGQYLLSLCFTRDSLSVLVTDPEKKRHLVLRNLSIDATSDDAELADNVRSLIASDSLLSLPFKQVKCIWDSRKYTVLPENFFDPATAKDVFNLSHPMDELDELHFKPVNALGITILFSIPNYIGNVLSERFPGIQFFSQTVPFLKACIKDVRWQNQYAIYATVNPTFADISLFHQGKLVLLNSFSIQAAEDILYFLLAICKERSLDPGTMHLRIAGDSHQSMDLLKKHFSFAGFLEPDSLLFPASAPVSSKYHRFLSLLNLYNCE